LPFEAHDPQRDRVSRSVIRPARTPSTPAFAFDPITNAPGDVFGPTTNANLAVIDPNAAPFSGNPTNGIIAAQERDHGSVVEWNLRCQRGQGRQDPAFFLFDEPDCLGFLDAGRQGDRNTVWFSAAASRLQSDDQAARLPVAPQGDRHNPAIQFDRSCPPRGQGSPPGSGGCWHLVIDAVKCGKEARFLLFGKPSQRWTDVEPTVVAHVPRH